jgi:hypothetical protein
MIWEERLFKKIRGEEKRTATYTLQVCSVCVAIIGIVDGGGNRISRYRAV